MKESETLGTNRSKITQRAIVVLLLNNRADFTNANVDLSDIRDVVRDDSNQLKPEMQSMFRRILRGEDLYGED